ncbi:MAG: hypothetical protein ACM3QY_02710 [Candidatus Levyibacteriota bacterium]
MEVQSRTPLLLASTATRWLGTARIPRALAEAGFEVGLLTPRNALAEKSRYVSRIGYLPDDATPAQWAIALGGMVEAMSPRIVVPCDDMAFRLLHMIVQDGRNLLRPELALRVSALIRQSLGDPGHYEASVDKTLMPPAAEALGIRVPPWAVADTPRQAEAFAAVAGYPVVLKRAHGFAGQGVAICADGTALARAFETFTRANAQDPVRRVAHRHLAQAHIPGRIQYYIATAWRGDLIAGYAGEKVVAHPEPVGPPTVARYFRSPALREITARLVRGFAISGHFFAEFVVPDRGGEPCLLELNRRITPASHRGSARNVDFCAALYAGLHGRPSTSGADIAEGDEGISVFFPGEWLRDPESSYLTDYPSDVPWDEPELFEALLALRSTG